MKSFVQKFFSVSLLFVAVGCGGGSSGVDSDKFIDELSTEELTTLCEWAAEEQGGAGVKNCGNTMVTVRTTEACVADTSNRPHCKVETIEDCFASIDGDSCKIFSTTECQAYIACAVMTEE